MVRRIHIMMTQPPPSCLHFTSHITRLRTRSQYCPPPPSAFKHYFYGGGGLQCTNRSLSASGQTSGALSSRSRITVTGRIAVTGSPHQHYSWFPPNIGAFGLSTLVRGGRGRDEYINGRDELTTSVWGSRSRQDQVEIILGIRARVQAQCVHRGPGASGHGATTSV
jgi:hypothetical protein